MNSEIIALLEAVRLARLELQGLRDPRRNATVDRTVRRLSDLLESKDVDRALARLNMEDSPPIAPTEPVDLRVPYPWRSH